MISDQPHVFLFRWIPASFTPSAPAFCRVAVGVRLSLRATTLVFVFSRTIVFSIRTSSFVHGRDFFVFFTIGRFISGILSVAAVSLSQKTPRQSALALTGRPAGLAAAVRRQIDS